MKPTPTSGRNLNIWERPGMGRHWISSPVSREQRLAAAGLTAPGRQARRRVAAATRIYQGLREDAGRPGRARCGHPAVELRKSETWCQVADLSGVTSHDGLRRGPSGQRRGTGPRENIQRNLQTLHKKVANIARCSCLESEPAVPADCQSSQLIYLLAKRRLRKVVSIARP
jgi:hypothetical protein